MSGADQPLPYEQPSVEEIDNGGEPIKTAPIQSGG